MQPLEGCQIPCLPKLAEGKAVFGPQPFIIRIKRMLARPWNYHVKYWLKRGLASTQRAIRKMNAGENNSVRSDGLSAGKHLQVGDWVIVLPLKEIQATLNPFKELNGCAFLEDMKQYCGTRQRVFKVMERFLDERDYQVKRARGIVLLEGVHCQGTPVFGRCDRACLSFWREEWLEKMDGQG